MGLVAVIIPAVPLQVPPILDAAFKNNALNVAIACVVVATGVSILAFGRRQVADAILKFYQRPSGERLRWFEQRPNPTPSQAMRMACALGIVGTAFGVVMLVMTLRA